MRVPISWLKEYVDILISTEELAKKITLAGLEVAAVERLGDWWDTEKIVVGQVTSVSKHPDADRLVVIEVEYGAERREKVVAGAPNLFAFRETAKLPVLKVAFAMCGASIVDAHSKEQPRPMKKLKPSKIRGVLSSGMACSERELGLSDDHEGVIILPEDAPVGLPLRQYLGDDILQIDMTPDMARCLSMIGIAREVAALTDVRLRLPEDKCLTQGKDRASDYVSVEIENSQLCQRYTGMIVRDVKIGHSPKWLQARLVKAGMRPINNIVDITNYVMLEYGQPLHAFDYDFLLKRDQNGKPRIVVRTARAGEKITTIDGLQRELDESMLLITDGTCPIAIAGVMGGQDTQVGDTTTNVLLESATFDGINNRRTCQKLKLNSESSYRFTRGVPATLNPIAARRAAELMRLYAGGRIVHEIVDHFPTPQETRVIYTTQSQILRQLGINLCLDNIVSALQKLDFTVERIATLDEATRSSRGAFGLHLVDKEPVLRCTAPWHRLDIQFPSDLTEEVARIVGYEHLNTTLMDEALPAQTGNPILESEDKLRDILVGCGLNENINYALTTEENHAKLRLWEQNSQPPFVTLANPLSSNRRVMRRSLLVSALENLEYNARFFHRHVNFEIGRVYLPDKSTDVRPCEERHLCILLNGQRTLSSVHKDHEDGPASGEKQRSGGYDENFDFFDIKGIVETMLKSLGFGRDDVEFNRIANPTYGPRCAEIKIKGNVEGIVGELHPEVQSAFELPKSRICLANLHIGPLVRPSWQIQIMPAISAYPPVVEDLALVVDEQVTAAQLAATIYSAGGELLADVELFDVYRGKPLAEGKKSLAYRLTYQSMETTLTDASIEKIRTQILKETLNQHNAQLRS